MSGGSPVQDETLNTPAVIRLLVPRTQWMYAPDSKYGSDFYAAHVRIKDTAQLEEISNRALAPLVNDGRAIEAVSTTTDAKRGAVELSVEITDAEGEVESFTFSPVGKV